MVAKPRVLLLASQPTSLVSFIDRMHDIGASVIRTVDHREAEAELMTGSYDICVFRASRTSPATDELISFVTSRHLKTAVVISVTEGEGSDAVRVLKLGASDFVKSESLDGRLADAVIRLIQSTEPQGRSSTHVEAHAGDAADIELVGRSTAISEIRSAVELVARSQTSVLITGESGTGKEIVARMMHAQSPRASNPFVAINCAALPKDVFENELFGHEKGAFTGALLKKMGCFELADGGTLFLDEIAEMASETQAKLLRALESKSFRRLGGRDEITVDVRIIAATNKNVVAALASRELREDLYYRLSVIEISMPPLRERPEDVPVLVGHFLAMFRERYGKQKQQFSLSALKVLTDYSWPGNVRELRNVVERAVVICPHDVIDPHYIPERVQAHSVAAGQISIPVGCSAEEAERILILQTLASTGNNKAKAARILGVSRKTLHNKLSGFPQKFSA